MKGGERENVVTYVTLEVNRICNIKINRAQHMLCTPVDEDVSRGHIARGCVQVLRVNS